MIQIDTDINIAKSIYQRRFIIGISSCNYEGQAVPQSAICTLETQESPWCTSVWIQRPENWLMEVLTWVWRSKNQECQYLRAEDGCPSSKREEMHYSSTFLFCSNPEQIGWCPLTSVRVSSLLILLIQIFWKHPHRHTQKCFTNYLDIP